MGVRVVTRAEVSPSAAYQKLSDQLRPLVKQLEEVSIGRIRTGVPPLRLIEIVEAKLEGDADPDAFLDEVVRETLRVAAQDAEGKRRKYRAFAMGATIREGKRPELLTIDFQLEPEDLDQAPTRESEILAAASSMRQWGEGAARLHLELMKAVNGSITNLTSALTELAGKVGDATSKADEARWNFETSVFQGERELKLEVERLQQAGRRSERMWTSLDGLFKKFDPLIDLIAAGPNAGPTVAEIETVFAADPDLITIAKAYKKATKKAERDVLRRELKNRWEALEDETKKSIGAALSQLDQPRAIALLAWMKQQGFS